MSAILTEKAIGKALYDYDACLCLDWVNDFCWRRDCLAINEDPSAFRRLYEGKDYEPCHRVHFDLQEQLMPVGQEGAAEEAHPRSVLDPSLRLCWAAGNRFHLAHDRDLGPKSQSHRDRTSRASAGVRRVLFGAHHRSGTRP